MDRWVTRIYERYRARYLTITVAFVFADGVVISSASVAIAGHFEGLSVVHALLGIGILVLADGVAAIAILVAMRREFALARAWLARPARDEASAVFEMAIGFARRWRAPGAAAVAIPVLAGALTVPALAHRFTLREVAGMGAVAVSAELLFMVSASLVLEVAFRPVLREAFALLPSPPDLAGLSRRLRSKIALALFTAPLVGGLLVGSIVSRTGSGATGLLQALGLSIAAAALIGLFLALPLAESLLGPIRELMGSTKAVGRGELGVDLPVTDSEELGFLTASFNEMLVGLRERESLRSHNVELVDELRASRSRIVAAADEERRRVERDLHDGAQQRLVLAQLKLGQLARHPERDELVGELQADLDRALAELRDLAHGLYPQVLESDGLPGALQDAATRAALPTTVECDGAGRYRPELEAAVYFCCLEALQNASKHAGPGASITVCLAERTDLLEFQVQDTGRGFERTVSASRGGLQNMVDRIGALGGELRIDSRPGAGTTVIGSVPV